MTERRPLRLATGRLAVLLTLLLLAAACGSDGGGANGETGGELPTIRIAGLASQNAAPIFLAVEKYAEEYGFEAQVDILASGGETVSGVATGQYDFGTAGAGALLFNAHNEGLPVTLVAPVGMAYPEDYFVISSKFASSQEEAEALAADLTPIADETFAVNAPGVVLEAMLAEKLIQGGLDFADVRIEHISFPDQVPALASGAVAAAVPVEPFATQAVEQGAAFRPYERPNTPPEPAAVLHANSDWIEENREAAEAFMGAFHAASQEIAKEGYYSEDSLAAIERYTEEDPEVISAGREPIQPGDLAVDLDQWRDYQEFFLELGSLDYDEPIDVEEMWDFSLRDAVVGDSG
jgi:ABC-type nitrate/sulfonate/bicarbonate transport system substrate-binding protein